MIISSLVCPAARQQCPGRQWSGRQRSRRGFAMPDKSITMTLDYIIPLLVTISSLMSTSVLRGLLFNPKMHCNLTALEGLCAYRLLAYHVNTPASDRHDFSWQQGSRIFGRPLVRYNLNQDLGSPFIESVLTRLERTSVESRSTGLDCAMKMIVLPIPEYYGSSFSES